MFKKLPFLFLPAVAVMFAACNNPDFNNSEFLFSDRATEKTFDFPDYERCFNIPLLNADNSVEVSIPDDDPWLQARVTTISFQGEYITELCFFLAENPGKNARQTTARISKSGDPHNLTVHVSQSGSEMEGSLKKGLSAFYNALNGDDWRNNSNWLSDKPMFEWHGITASKVVGLELFGLDGQAYFGTDNVWHMDLYSNNMHGEIPMEFWQASHCFESISIQREYLPTTTLPDIVWHEGLKKLNLSTTFMNAPLSPAIAKAVNLEILELERCNVGGPVPEEITSLAHLRIISLGECGIKGSVPENIGNLQRLEELYLFSNPDLGGTLPSGFYRLYHLQHFWLSGTRVGGTLSPDIKNLAELGVFYIEGCEFEGTIPEEFGQLENLQSYDFDANYFTAIPQFMRYVGNGWKNQKEWIDANGFAKEIPYYQRRREDGRPDDFIMIEECSSVLYPDINSDGKPLRGVRYIIDYSRCHKFPLPIWANVRYGFYAWNAYHGGAAKFPEYPYADDLQYPANEYYYDGKDWRHPLLEFPAREYWFDGSSWIHDASCPWDKDYVENRMISQSL